MRSGSDFLEEDGGGRHLVAEHGVLLERVLLLLDEHGLLVAVVLILVHILLELLFVLGHAL